MLQKGENMFEKKEILYSETLGVCQVFELIKLPSKNGEQVPYYGLRSVYDKSKVSYIPVEHHQVQLRPLISYEEAEKLSNTELDDYNEIQKREIDYVLMHMKNK